MKKKTDHLLEEVKLITNSEERNRALITKLKIVYREDQNKFERSKKEYGVIADYLEKEIDNIDDLFAKFEKAMDNNDYVSVEKKINLLDDKITKLGKRCYDQVMEERISPFGQKYFWVKGTMKELEQDEDSDIACVNDGYISITPVNIEMTNLNKINILQNIKMI